MRPRRSPAPAPNSLSMILRLMEAIAGVLKWIASVVSVYYGAAYPGRATITRYIVRSVSIGRAHAETCCEHIFRDLSGTAVRKKSLVAKYCARLTYESHTHNLNQVLSTCFLKSLYSKIASYKQTQQTFASSQWWVTSVTPLNQNSLIFFFDFFAFLKDRWSSGDLLTQRH